MNVDKERTLPLTICSPLQYPLESRFIKIQRYGVIACCLLIALGIAVTLLSHSSDSQHKTFFEIVSDSSPWRGPLVRDNITELRFLFLHYNVLILLGIALLILLPVIRIAMMALIFFLQKDFLYVFLSSLILVVLLVGFLLS